MFGQSNPIGNCCSYKRCVGFYVKFSGLHETLSVDIFGDIFITRLYRVSFKITLKQGIIRLKFTNEYALYLIHFDALEICMKSQKVVELNF